MDDSELLRLYLHERSQSAFAELVQRHLPLVYGAALRQAGGNSSQAEDIAQAVFILLARKAPSLLRHPTLVGWLHTTVYFTASDTQRAARRRRWQPPWDDGRLEIQLPGQVCRRIRQQRRPPQNI